MGATGDVIDLVARLFNLSSYDAVKKLAYDFGIDPDVIPAGKGVPERGTALSEGKDEWSGFADLLANLIEKYAAALDLDNLPEPTHPFGNKETVNNLEHPEDSIENTETA